MLSLLAHWQRDGISTSSPTAFAECLKRPSLCAVVWTVCNCQRHSVTPLGSANNRTLVFSVIQEFWVQTCGRKPLKRVFRKAAHAAVTHRFCCRAGVAQKCGCCWKLTLYICTNYTLVYLFPSRYKSCPHRKTWSLLQTIGCNEPAPYKSKQLKSVHPVRASWIEY